jgi:hypothetical protein
MAQNPDQAQNRRMGAVSRYRPSDSILCGDSFDADQFLSEYGAENSVYTNLPVPIMVGYGEISAPCYQGDGVILITPLWSRPLVELLRKLNSEGVKAVRLSPRASRPMLVVPFITVSTDMAYEMAKRVWDMRNTLSELLDSGAEYGSFMRYEGLVHEVIAARFQALFKMYLNVSADEIFAPRPAQQPH